MVVQGVSDSLLECRPAEVHGQDAAVRSGDHGGGTFQEDRGPGPGGEGASGSHPVLAGGAAGQAGELAVMGRHDNGPLDRGKERLGRLGEAGEGIGIEDHGHYMNTFDGAKWSGWSAVPGDGTTLVSDAAAVYGGKLYLFGVGIKDHKHYVNVGAATA